MKLDTLRKLDIGIFIEVKIKETATLIIDVNQTNNDIEIGTIRDYTCDNCYCLYHCYFLEIAPKHIAKLFEVS